MAAFAGLGATAATGATNVYKEAVFQLHSTHRL